MPSRRLYRILSACLLLRKGEVGSTSILRKARKALSRVTNRAIWTALRSIASAIASRIKMGPHVGGLLRLRLVLHARKRLVELAARLLRSRPGLARSSSFYQRLQDGYHFQSP